MGSRLKRQEGEPRWRGHCDTRTLRDWLAAMLEVQPTKQRQGRQTMGPRIYGRIVCTWLTKMS
jgi:hypothetical protein